MFSTHDFSSKNGCVSVCVTWCIINTTLYLLNDVYYTHFNPHSFACMPQIIELVLQWRSFFHSFAAEEVPLSWWLVVMAMLVVDGVNDTHGLWLAGDFHRFKEREIGWSTTK